MLDLYNFVRKTVQSVIKPVLCIPTSHLVNIVISLNMYWFHTSFSTLYYPCHITQKWGVPVLPFIINHVDDLSRNLTHRTYHTLLTPRLLKLSVIEKSGPRLVWFSNIMSYSGSVQHWWPTAMNNATQDFWMYWNCASKTCPATAKHYIHKCIMINQSVPWRCLNFQ